MLKLQRSLTRLNIEVLPPPRKSSCPLLSNPDAVANLVNLTQHRIPWEGTLDEEVPRSLDLWEYLWGIVLFSLLMWEDPANCGQHRPLAWGTVLCKRWEDWEIGKYVCILSAGDISSGVMNASSTCRSHSPKVIAYSPDPWAKTKRFSPKLLSIKVFHHSKRNESRKPSFTSLPPPPHRHVPEVLPMSKRPCFPSFPGLLTHMWGPLSPPVYSPHLLTFSQFLFITVCTHACLYLRNLALFEIFNNRSCLLVLFVDHF